MDIYLYHHVAGAPVPPISQNTTATPRIQQSDTASLDLEILI